MHHNRVKGRLQPTRGLGDGAYKMKEFSDFLFSVRRIRTPSFALTVFAVAEHRSSRDCASAIRCMAGNRRTQPLVLCARFAVANIALIFSVQDITTHKLEPNDEYLILATDGESA